MALNRIGDKVVKKKDVGIERRKLQRRTIKIDVNFGLSVGKDNAPATLDKTYTVNMGEGGLCIYTNEPLPIGAPILIKLQLPDIKNAISIETKVVWSMKLYNEERYRTGLTFISIKDEDKKRIKEFVLHN